MAQQGVGADEEVVERQVGELPLVRLEADPVEEEDGGVASVGRMAQRRAVGVDNWW